MAVFYYYTVSVISHLMTGNRMCPKYTEMQECPIISVLCCALNVEINL